MGFKKRLICAVSLLMLAACSGDYKTLTNGSEGGLSCPTKLSENSFVLEGKIAKQAFIENAKEEGKLHIAAEGRLKKGEKVVVTVNRICLMERSDSSGYLLTETIKLKTKNHKHSFTESHTFTLPREIDFGALEGYAEADDCVEMVAPNVVFETTALPNDPRFTSQTHLPAIGYNSSYDWFFTGPKSIKSDTIVAIIDNGVDINHQDLKDILWQNTAEKNGVVGVDDDNNGYVDDVYGYDFATDVADPNHKYPSGSNLGYSHGSHVAGLAAGATNNGVGIAGVMAKNAKIMSLNVFGNSQGAMTSNIDTAIRYAADMGAKVLNLSLGGRGATPSTESALRYAVSKGAIVVVAAGNDSATLTSSTFYTPASYGASIEGMITVGATDANPNSVGNLCSFSNKSTTYVEVGGPGCDTSKSGMGVLSLLRNNSYGLMPGTSMASPVVAGVATVLYSLVRDGYNRVLTPTEVESLLKRGSKNFSALNSTIKDGKNVDLATLKATLEAEFGPLNPPDNGGGGDDNPPPPPVECP